MKKRRALPIILFLLLSVPLLSCSGKVQNAEEIQDISSISIWYCWDIPSCRTALTGLVAQFNASQERIRVEARYVPDEDFKKQLALSMAEGNMPDIAVVDSSDFRFYHDMEPFYELTGKIDGLEDYMPMALAPCQIGDKIYGLPFGMDCPALIYNERLLREAGCQVPRTWEEFCDTAEKVSASGSRSGFSFAGISSEESLSAFLPMLWSMDGQERCPSGEGGRAAYGILAELAEKGVLDESCVSMTLSDVMYQFAKGRTAMMINTPMTVNYIRQNAPGLVLGVAPLPSSVTTCCGEILAVSASGDTEASLEFLRFLAEPERMRENLEYFGFLAPREDVLRLQYLEDEQMQEFVKIFRTARMREMEPWWPKLSEILTDAMDQVILGEDVEGVLEKAQAAADALLKEEGP